MFLSVMRRQIFYQRDSRNSVIRIAVHTVHARQQFLPLHAFRALGLSTRQPPTSLFRGRPPFPTIMDSYFHAILKRFQDYVNSVPPDSALRDRFTTDTPGSLRKLRPRPTFQPCMRSLMLHSGTKH